MNSNSKKWIASAAALQILLYHCWVPVFKSGTFPGSIERFLVAATYSGVDIFFFISAYSLVSRPVTDYRSFIVNRAVRLLPLFLVALAFGRFLWFIPSIMIMYIVLPPLYKVCRKRPGASFFLLFAGWALIVYLILGLILPGSELGIFLFRIPGMILGAYAAGCSGRYSVYAAGNRERRMRRKLIAGVIFLAAGFLLIYKFGYTRRLNVPFKGVFYLTGIPVMLGTVLLTDLITADRSSRLITFFGSMTLELYFTQMVLGTILVTFFFRVTGSRIAVNILTFSVIIVISKAVKELNDRLTERLSVG